MRRPTTVEVLGVHRLRVTKRLVRETVRDSACNNDRDSALDLLQGVVLIEVLVENTTKRFDAGHFTQPLQDQPKNRWQVAYDEVYLSPDGKQVLSRGERQQGPQVPSFRVAFWLHYYQPGISLLTTYGPVACPEVTDMPARLKKLVRYAAPD